MRNILQSIRVLAILSVITGGFYTFVIWGVGQLFFRDAAEGSLILYHGEVVGSALVGQKFTQPEYFWVRPSAADYATLPSGASNAAWTSKTLHARIDATASKLRTVHGLGANVAIPAELLTTSGSGLDPHLSLEAVLFQFDRVTRARHLDDMQQKKLRALIEQNVEAGMFSTPHINILRLNLAVDTFFGKVV